MRPVHLIFIVVAISHANGSHNNGYNGPSHKYLPAVVEPSIDSVVTVGHWQSNNNKNGESQIRHNIGYGHSGANQGSRNERNEHSGWQQGERHGLRSQERHSQSQSSYAVGKAPVAVAYASTRKNNAQHLPNLARTADSHNEGLTDANDSKWLLKLLTAPYKNQQGGGQRGDRRWEGQNQRGQQEWRNQGNRQGYGQKGIEEYTTVWGKQEGDKHKGQHWEQRTHWEWLPGQRGGHREEQHGRGQEQYGAGSGERGQQNGQRGERWEQKEERQLWERIDGRGWENSGEKRQDSGERWDDKHENGQRGERWEKGEGQRGERLGERGQREGDRWDDKREYGQGGERRGQQQYGGQRGERRGENGQERGERWNDRSERKYGQRGERWEDNREGGHHQRGNQRGEQRGNRWEEGQGQQYGHGGQRGDHQGRQGGWGQQSGSGQRGDREEGNSGRGRQDEGNRQSGGKWEVRGHQPQEVKAAVKISSKSVNVKEYAAAISSKHGESRENKNEQQERGRQGHDERRPSIKLEPPHY